MPRMQVIKCFERHYNVAQRFSRFNCGDLTAKLFLALGFEQGEDLQGLAVFWSICTKDEIQHLESDAAAPADNLRLSNVIKNKAEIQSVVRQPKNQNINVITAGNIPPNITEVVGSKRISSILSRLKDNFELVIVDAPPLIISDSFNLASKVDGVILVIVPGETTIDQAKAIKEQLDRSEARMLGIVFNKITAQTARSYGDYQYQSLYSPRYYGDYIASSTHREEKRSDSSSKKIMAFFEHGEVPDDVAQEVEHAITAIKTQPRNLVNKVNKLRKPKKNGNSD
jgi:cellulose biosynthesis protein BcsQ